MGKAADDLKNEGFRAKDTVGGLHGSISTTETVDKRSGGYNRYLVRWNEGEEPGPKKSFAEWTAEQKGK